MLRSARPNEVKAEDQDADRPTVWIELGGAAGTCWRSGRQLPGPPSWRQTPIRPVLQPVTPLQAQQPSEIQLWEEGKILFQPEGSDWFVSAGARIGRSSSARHVQHQTNKAIFKYQYTFKPDNTNVLDTKEDFADTHTSQRESHTILDFSAGKDVGLGMFGKDSSSILSVGVRFAQFSSRATFDVRARPDLQIKYYTAGGSRFAIPHFHTYHITGRASRSFRGLGPSLSWKGSAPFAGNRQESELTFDWGMNVALLYGKQKTQVQHHESGHYFSQVNEFEHGVANAYISGLRPPLWRSQRCSLVTVPNVGGFAGISFGHGSAKVSFGYRADFFFGAIDGGIDAAKKENVGFYGPFASVSIGLGR